MSRPTVVLFPRVSSGAAAKRTLTLTACASLVITLLLTGCSYAPTLSDSRAETAPTATAPPPAKEKQRLSSVERGVFNLSRDVCSLTPPKLLANEYRAKGGPVAIAETYAEKAYAPGMKQAAFEGCLAGFRKQGVL